MLSFLRKQESIFTFYLYLSSVARKSKNIFAMSKRRHSTIFILCLLLAAAFVWLDHSPIRRNWQAQPKSSEQVKTHDFEKYHEKTFTVLKVVDGDTIDIDVPDGKYNHTRIRLWGIDTPETKNPKTGVMYFGPEAADFTTKSALGKQVMVYLEETRTRDKYDRLLAYIKLPDGRFLNEVLLSEGFAYADVRFRHSFYHKYQQLEAAARSQKRGLWEKVTRDQLPEWLQERNPKLLQSK
jgi:micrococcal nuclease